MNIADHDYQLGDIVKIINGYRRGALAEIQRIDAEYNDLIYTLMLIGTAKKTIFVKLPAVCFKFVCHAPGAGTADSNSDSDREQGE